MWYVIAIVLKLSEVSFSGLDGLYVCGSLDFFVLVDAVGGRTIFNLLGRWVSYCVCNCFYFFGVLILVRD